MSLEEFRGVAWAFSELMKRASADMARGEAKSERAPSPPVDAGRRPIGLLAVKVLRRAVGWREAGKT
jgi:hypothetical protein